MTPFRDFLNRLKILNSLDRAEMAAVGLDLTGPEWQAFRTDPFRSIMRLSDDRAELVWKAIEKRMQPP